MPSIANEQREELTRWAQSRTLPARDLFRARLILALADGYSYRQIQSSLHTNAPTISRWKQRFEQAGIDGVQAQHKGSSPLVADAALQAGIARQTPRKPADRSTQWSCRKMAALGLSQLTVQRVWTQLCLKPHRPNRRVASNDPHLEKTEANNIGLCLHPPQKAAVFCVVGKTAFRALDRLDPVLPLSLGLAERQGFEHYRHGTLSFYVALDVKTGQVQGIMAGRHTSHGFVSFLEGLIGRTRWARKIYVVLDNLSAHKTKDVERLLPQHPQVCFHFTSTYSPRLNQVELWFAKIQRDAIRRGVFTSIADRGHKLRRYIRAYSKSVKPFRWIYTDSTRRISTNHISETAY